MNYLTDTDRRNLKGLLHFFLAGYIALVFAIFYYCCDWNNCYYHINKCNNYQPEVGYYSGISIGNNCGCH